MKLILILACCVSVCIIVIASVWSTRNTPETFLVAADNLYDLVIIPEVFDMLDISQSMNFKELRIDCFNIMLKHLKHNVSSMTESEIKDVLSRQIGSKYEIILINKRESNYEIVVHQPSKMYGFFIILPIMNVWTPKALGYIFEDNIRLVSGTFKRLSDFREWPFNDDIRNYG
jgi:hypothetical protein